MTRRPSIHMTDTERAALRAELAIGPSIAAAARRAGVSRTTAAAEASRMRGEGIAVARGVGPKGVIPPPSSDGPYRLGGSAIDRRIVGLEAEVARLKKSLRDAHAAAIDDEAIRNLLGVIAGAPEASPQWTIHAEAKTGKDRTPEVPVVIFSDWHFGEVVAPAAVDGFNAYGPEIAEERVRRLVESVVRLCRRSGPGVYPGIVVALLGDFISGGLHPELAKTDGEERIPSMLRCRDILVWAIERLAAEFGQVYVPCAAGNHGRETDKPEFKRYVYKNFDWLIYQLLKRAFAGRPDVVIDVPEANEVHFRVFGLRFLGLHGDMMGVKGGDGIIGAIGPIMRGEIKVRGQVSTLGRDYDIALMGHWHQELWLPRAFVNNTLKGFDEYAKNKLRAPPTSPAQSLFFVHPRRGITSRWSVRVDSGDYSPAPWVSWQEAVS